MNELRQVTDNPWRYPGWWLIGALLVMGCKPSEPLNRYQQGEQAARVCSGCHGIKGHSKVASYPSLAGLDQAYIEQQLYAFKSGQRVSAVMGSVSQSLNETDIQAVAHYYSEQHLPVVTPTQ